MLVDTSVWIDHLRYGNTRLARLLSIGEVLCHPFVVGEVACGTLTRRNEILGLLKALPQAVRADDDEVLALIETRDLHGRGLGWVDAHLLASAILGQTGLWTLDKRLREAARRLSVSVEPS